jgi:hypothetical protein
VAMKMDLGALIGRTAATIRKNWILIVPPIVTQAVVPLALFAVAALTIFPLVAAFSLTGDVWGLVQTVVVGATVLAIVGLLVDTFVTAGWAYMNKRAIVDGRTKFDDLWTGARRYFPRILGGRILVGVIVVIPIAALVAAFIVSIAALNIGPLTTPEQPTPETLAGLFAPRLIALLGILVIVGLVELVLYIFLLPWMQALVMDELGVWASIKTGFSFVRRNFVTTIGYLVISLVASIAVYWVSSFFSPGLSYALLSQPAVYTSGTRLLGLILGAGAVVNSLISAVLSAFFTLLLFMIYADRTRGIAAPTSVQGIAAAPAAPASQAAGPLPRIAPRGMKYCINCGATIISLAVFCPSCGARQPPLPPE